MRPGERTDAFAAISVAERSLSAERLGEAMRTATADEDMRRRVAATGRRVRAEGGVQRAVDVFHRFFPEPAAAASVRPERGAARYVRPWDDHAIPA